MNKYIGYINQILGIYNLVNFYTSGTALRIKDVAIRLKGTEWTNHNLLKLTDEIRTLKEDIKFIHEIKLKDNIKSTERQFYYKELEELIYKWRESKLVDLFWSIIMQNSPLEIKFSPNSNKTKTKEPKPQPKDIEKINKLLGFFQYLKFYKDLGNRGKIKKLKSSFKTIHIYKMLKNKTSNISHKDNLLNEDNIQKDRENLWKIKYILQLDIANSYVEDIEDCRNRLEAMYSKYENLRMWKKYLKYLSKIEKNNEIIK